MLKRLREYNWPGNIRELQNLIERALILNRGESLTFPDLEINSFMPDGKTTPISVASNPPNQTLAEREAEYIKNTLLELNGKISGPGGAAERLGINPSTLRSRIKKLRILPQKEDLS